MAREKSVPGFKASQDSLTLLLDITAAGDFKLKPVLIYHSENPRAHKNHAKSTLSMFYKKKAKTWTVVHLFTKWLTKYVKPAYSLRKKSFQNITIHWQCSWLSKSSDKVVQ